MNPNFSSSLFIAIFDSCKEIVPRTSKFRFLSFLEADFILALLGPFLLLDGKLPSSGQQDQDFFGSFFGSNKVFTYKIILMGINSQNSNWRLRITINFNTLLKSK